MGGQIGPSELLKRILQGSAPPRPLFLPIVFSLAARIENLPLPAFLTNPTKITQALRQIRPRLYSDSVTCYFDPYLEVEALGAILEWRSGAKPSVRWSQSPLAGDLPEGIRTLDQLPTRGRIPVAVEVIRRSKALIREECLLTVGISGPFALAAQLVGAEPAASGDLEMSARALELASEAIAPVAKAFLEAGANVVFIREEFPASPSSGSDLASLLATTVNIIRFYQAIPVLLLNNEARHLNLALRQSGSLECVVCPVWAETMPAMPEEWIEPAPANLGLAVPVGVIAESRSAFEKSAEQLRRFVQTSQPALITTSGDVPETEDLKNLNKLREFLIP